MTHVCACRVLFEVASLERSEDTVQEACLRHLAASVRATHKIYHFAGGFDAELSALFDKVGFSSWTGALLALHISSAACLLHPFLLSWSCASISDIPISTMPLLIFCQLSSCCWSGQPQSTVTCGTDAEWPHLPHRLQEVRHVLALV